MNVLLLTVKWHVYLLVKMGIGGGVGVGVGGLGWGGVTNEMEFSIKLHLIKSEWSIVYIEGPHVIIKRKKYLYFFL